MKRTFRMAIIFLSVSVLLAGIGLWRHHYLKIMKAEPEKVYNGTLSQPNTLPDKTKTSKVTLIEREGSTGIGKDDSTSVEKDGVVPTQRIDNSITPDAIENTSDTYAGTIFSDIAEQDLSPEVVAALKKYEEVQSAQTSLETELNPFWKQSLKTGMLSD